MQHVIAQESLVANLNQSQNTIRARDIVFYLSVLFVKVVSFS